jgi:hypothetical protein
MFLKDEFMQFTLRLNFFYICLIYGGIFHLPPSPAQAEWSLITPTKIKGIFVIEAANQHDLKLPFLILPGGTGQPSFRPLI